MQFFFSDRASLLWEGCWAFGEYTERLVKAVVVWAFPDFFPIRILTAPLYPNISLTLSDAFAEVARGFRFEYALFV